MIGPFTKVEYWLPADKTWHQTTHVIDERIFFQMNVDDISAFILPDQPLISETTVTQDDVDRQEAKVSATRAKLAKALEALSG